MVAEADIIYYVQRIRPNRATKATLAGQRISEVV